MRRGIFAFLPAEVAYLAELFVQIDRDLDKKIQAAFVHGEGLLELSEQEIETVLDILPQPSANVVADNLRRKLTIKFRQLE